MDVDPLAVVGQAATALGLAAATFVAVSFYEIKRRQDEQLERGEQPYELKLDVKKPEEVVETKAAKKQEERRKRLLKRLSSGDED